MDLHKIFNTDHLAATLFYICNLLLSQVIVHQNLFLNVLVINKCEQAKIPVKSIHAIRRTLNSRMRVNDADSVTTAVLIGNTPEVNENFYTYDVSESDYKKELIRKVSLCG